ncbi:hypothetical protein Tco_1125906 [Tanacetum coccineum]
MRMGPVSGVGDAYYIERAMNHYEIETGLPFKLCHCWEVLKDHPKWKEIAIPNFNTGSEGDTVLEIQRPEGRDKARAVVRKNKGSKSSASSSVNEDALARLMLTEMGAQEKEEHLAFLDIKRREVECRERELIRSLGRGPAKGNG